jgi:bifunctional N-acetylglucosamine-1-phosphate-uridyltransferase/glucosamine-1-phosphate-acetyltransferase GlmU-like protein
VIARDVPANALALGRGEQVIKPTWTQRLASKLSANHHKGA